MTWRRWQITPVDRLAESEDTTGSPDCGRRFDEQDSVGKPPATRAVLPGTVDPGRVGAPPHQRHTAHPGHHMKKAMVDGICGFRPHGPPVPGRFIGPPLRGRLSNRAKSARNTSTNGVMRGRPADGQTGWSERLSGGRLTGSRCPGLDGRGPTDRFRLLVEAAFRCWTSPATALVELQPRIASTNCD